LDKIFEFENRPRSSPALLLLVEKLTSTANHPTSTMVSLLTAASADSSNSKRPLPVDVSGAGGGGPRALRDDDNATDAKRDINAQKQ